MITGFKMWKMHAMTLAVSAMDLLKKKPYAHNDTFTQWVGYNEIFYMLRVSSIIVGIVMILLGFGGMLFARKAEMIAEKRKKIRRILLLIGLIGGILLFMNIAKSILDNLFGYTGKFL